MGFRDQGSIKYKDSILLRGSVTIFFLWFICGKITFVCFKYKLSIHVLHKLRKRTKQ